MALLDQLETLQNKLTEIESAPPPEPEPKPDPQQAERIAELEAQLKTLQNKLTEIESAPPPEPEPNPQQAERIAELEAQLKTLQNKLTEIESAPPFISDIKSSATNLQKILHLQELLLSLSLSPNADVYRQLIKFEKEIKKLKNTSRPNKKRKTSKPSTKKP